MQALFLYAFILGTMSDRIAQDNALSCAEDITEAVYTVGPLPSLSPSETARLVARMAANESGCLANVENKQGDCGVMQLRGVAKQGVECSTIRHDRVLGLVLGLRWLHVAVKACNGSVLHGVAMYASGSCFKAVTLAKTRCRLAEVNCQ